jgi:hypothetical protein
VYQRSPPPRRTAFIDRVLRRLSRGTGSTTSSTMTALQIHETSVATAAAQRHDLDQPVGLVAHVSLAFTFV